MTDEQDRPFVREFPADARDMRAAWEENASGLDRGVRAPGHDSYWLYHRDQFLELLPPPGKLTIDLGCGEGRLSRDLKARGHSVVGIDGSPTMVRGGPRGGSVDRGRSSPMPRICRSPTVPPISSSRSCRSRT